MYTHECHWLLKVLAKYCLSLPVLMVGLTAGGSDPPASSPSLQSRGLSNYNYIKINNSNMLHLPCQEVAVPPIILPLTEAVADVCGEDIEYHHILIRVMKNPIYK